MEVIARSKYIRQSSRKLQLVANLLPGMLAQQAVDLLEQMNVRSAKKMLLLVKQGIGNAANNFNLDKKTLRIKTVEVGKGPIIKRARFVSRGRVHSIHKPTAHIKMVFEAEIEKVPAHQAVKTTIKKSKAEVPEVKIKK